jgi:heme-degrading monooxygenase HmoA
MIVRIWRTHVQERREQEYRDFARSRSLPMFRAQPGFLGVMFTAHRAERAVISMWKDVASVEALDRSPTYRSTVSEIEASGFLRGPSTVEVLEVDEFFVEPVVVRQGSS